MTQVALFRDRVFGPDAVAFGRACAHAKDTHAKDIAQNDSVVSARRGGSRTS
jgi:hypothetical protein